MLKKNDILHTSFDDYLILEKIGEGGNGTVYKVQSEDGKIYAAKVICKNDVSKEKIKRFKNEIGFCQKYDNDYIIKGLCSIGRTKTKSGRAEMDKSKLNRK